MHDEQAERVRKFLAELAPEPGAGTLVGPHVRLTRRLAQGAMGAVWEAEHLTLGVPVAVKLLAARWTDDASMHERFVEEARAAARIASAHVVRVLDHGMYQSDLPYLVMEKLEGEDVARRLERDGPLPLEDVTQIVVQVGRGLQAAHAADIIHRDIKPSNLFLAEQDGRSVVKILDFGIAKRLDTPAGKTTSNQSAWGTPLYMSPEQLASPGRVDQRADLWALAVVAYECITGTLPFEGETVAALAVAMERGGFAPPSTLGVPIALDAFFRRGLARSVDERFASAGELVDSWLAALAKSPADHARRRLGMAALLAAGVALGAIAVHAQGDESEARTDAPPASSSQPPKVPQARVETSTTTAAEPSAAPAPTPSSPAATRPRVTTPDPVPSVDERPAPTADRPRKSRGF
jgi:serine/threonine-protein kinase